MARNPYTRLVPTRPKQAAVVAESRLRDDESTMQRCPLCEGGGMVPPSVAATFDDALKAMKETE